jgi:hypothetical protein
MIGSYAGGEGGKRVSRPELHLQVVREAVVEKLSLGGEVVSDAGVDRIVDQVMTMLESKAIGTIAELHAGIDAAIAKELGRGN